MLKNEILDRLIVAEYSSDIPVRWIRELAAETKLNREKLSEIKDWYDLKGFVGGLSQIIDGYNATVRGRGLLTINDYATQL